MSDQDDEDFDYNYHDESFTYISLRDTATLSDAERQTMMQGLPDGFLIGVETFVYHSTKSD